jgi:hypothetical protein
MASLEERCKCVAVNGERSLGLTSRHGNDWKGRHPIALRRGSASRKRRLTNDARSVDWSLAWSHFVAQGDRVSPLPVIPHRPLAQCKLFHRPCYYPNPNAHCLMLNGYQSLELSLPFAAFSEKFGEGGTRLNWFAELDVRDRQTQLFQYIDCGAPD